jgi:cytochrome b561
MRRHGRIDVPGHRGFSLTIVLVLYSADDLFVWHKSIGILVLVLVLVRIAE